MCHDYDLLVAQIALLANLVQFHALWMRGYAFYGFIKEDETRAPFMEHLGPYYYELGYEKKEDNS